MPHLRPGPSLFGAALVALVMTGCEGKPASSSAGDRGRVSFAYTTGRCGASTCPFDKPLMVGADEGVLIVEDDVPELFLRSTNPTAVTVHCATSRSNDKTPATEACAMGAPASGLNYDFTIEARAEGEAMIELRTSATSTDPSTLYDTIRVETRAADRIEVELGEDGVASPVANGSKYEVELGETVSVSRRAYKGDVELQASSGITLCTSSPNVVTLVSGGFVFAEQASQCSRLMFLGGRALLPGLASITASSENVSSTAATVRVSE